MEIILERVRSFYKRQRIPLRPLTLLVGENSSGKSTFLATVSCAFNDLRFPGSPGFNEAPYNLGTFDTIVTRLRGRHRRDESFSIGFSVDRDDGRTPREVIATYRNDYGNPVLKSVAIDSPNGAIKLTVSDSTLSGRVFLGAGNSAPSESVDVAYQVGDNPVFVQQVFAIAGAPLARFFLRDMQEPDNLSKQKKERVFQILTGSNPPYSSCFSFAPIRSKPRRTYDEFSEEYSPEGDHVPTMLARLLREEPSSTEGQRVHKALLRFGEESRLFKKIEVKRLGKKVSDPFQVQVTVAGPSVNLTDVGYGVSQALPIVVQSVLKTTSKALLLQQPEVHLHPRAQAALGSFFSDLVAEDDRMLLVETHSDYLVDRVRQEVAQGNLAPERVGILFFHKPQLETSVYALSLDSRGNVVDAPECYRDFFLQEELNLLNRTE